MIKEVTMYSVECDICGIIFIDDFRGYSAMGDPESIAEMAAASDWSIEDGGGARKYYCPNCCNGEAR